MTNSENNHVLNSHSIAYGSGSEGQSVTGVPNSTDSKGYWLVESEQKQRKAKIPCSSKIKLKHVTTNKYLTAIPNAKSPISRNSELSCTANSENAEYTIFEVVCLNPNASYWQRNDQIKLKNVHSNEFVCASKDHSFQHVIAGHIEAFAKSKPDSQCIWKVIEGAFPSENSS